MTVTAVVTDEGEEVFKASRFATALYYSNSPDSILAASMTQEKSQQDAARSATEDAHCLLAAFAGCKIAPATRSD